MINSDTITRKTSYVGQFGQTNTRFFHKGMEVSEEEAIAIHQKEDAGFFVPCRPIRSLTDI